MRLCGGGLAAGVGIGLLAAVAWVEVGTNIVASREQQRVLDELQPRLPAVPAPRAGKPLVLRIPAIDVVAPVVEGTDPPHLKQGIGHYVGTAQAGAVGNAVFAGHRTTYGRPFWKLDLVHPGDLVLVDTDAGVVTYRVEHTFEITPDQLSILRPSSSATITLITCTPRFSAARRLVVTGRLVRPVTTVSGF